MTIDILSWRSIIGCFCLVKTLPSKKNKFVLLALAFKYFIMCLLYIMNFILKAFLRYLCIGVYFACLLIWCSYFCIAVRLYFQISHFAMNHPFMFVFIHQWWIFALILRDGDVHPHPGPPRNLLKFMH